MYFLLYLNETKSEIYTPVIILILEHYFLENFYFDSRLIKTMANLFIWKINLER